MNANTLAERRRRLPADFRSYALDAKQHGNDWVPIAPPTLVMAAEEIERLRARVALLERSAGQPPAVVVP